MARKPCRFRNEDEEREFWPKQDSAEVVDWTKAQPVTLADLKAWTQFEPRWARTVGPAAWSRML
jgi:hypothetical protein